MFTHKQLCALAQRWLKRPPRQGGHGCHVAVTECQSGWSGEIPDAIGFRSAGHLDGSVLVECKTSRADFLADKNKQHRLTSKGLGSWRYYLVPEGIIDIGELPERWGLLTVNARGHIKAVVGAAVHAKNWMAFAQNAELWRHERDFDREQFLLVKLFNRIGDAEELSNKLKEQNNRSARLMRQVESLRAQLREVELQMRGTVRQSEQKLVAAPKALPEMN